MVLIPHRSSRDISITLSSHPSTYIHYLPFFNCLLSCQSLSLVLFESSKSQRLWTIMNHFPPTPQICIHCKNFLVRKTSILAKWLPILCFILWLIFTVQSLAEVKTLLFSPFSIHVDCLTLCPATFWSPPFVSVFLDPWIVFSSFPPPPLLLLLVRSWAKFCLCKKVSGFSPLSYFLDLFFWVHVFKCISLCGSVYTHAYWFIHSLVLYLLLSGYVPLLLQL